MFAIIISEKGGAERRESFDKNEINVGRVQGNDLMLPKGNVSKHHARLLFRDGRFIVTDLKSTNGTYVNGRKIAQATIVREGDKIYIGDFVLRLETNGASAAPPEATSGGEEESIRTLARDNVPPPRPMNNPPAVTLKAPTHPPGAPLPRPQASNVSNAPPQQQQAPTRPPEAGNYQLDQDPDDSAPVQKARMQSAAPPAATAMQGGGGGPPPLAGGNAQQRPMTMPLNQMSPPMMGARVPTAPPGGVLQQPQTAQPMQPMQPMPMPVQPTPQAAPVLAPPPQVAPPPPPPPLPPPPMAPPQATPPHAPPPPQQQQQQQQPPQPMPQAPSAAPPQVRPTSPPGRTPLKESPAQAGRRLALTMLMGRIADAVDLSALRSSPIVPDGLAQQIERAARDQANAMREEGEAPQDVDLDGVMRDAHRELVGLGAIGPLLEDEEVTEIHCVRYDQIFTVRSGSSVNEGLGFSSEEALYRVIARLAHQSGDGWRPGETVLERRLPRASLVAIAPPAAATHVLSIRKRRRVESTLEELVRSSAISRPMAQFLEACVAARANVLVSGAAAGGVLSALASSAGPGERVCVVQDVEEIAVGNAHAVPLSIVDTRKAGEDTVRAAARLRPDRLVVAQLAGGVAAATVDAMAEGSEGVLASISAPTLRQALSRLVAQLVLHRPGLSLEAMRDVVGEAFDVAVEVNALPDGRLRVMRIAELGGSDAKGIVARDIFVYSADANQPSGEGTHSATGVVPRLANDLATRGLKLDPAIFKRAGR
ncbi:MAG: Type secretion system hydrolase TadA/VirB11/CpaF, TadA subfamily [Myxococcaceae bacterium]|nr:Type secretion system hydrolase TadA/VirB11/CpaF, TadA subfamily [Myxococcaceae bacterium]